jgi:hypothetical protein
MPTLYLPDLSGNVAVVEATDEGDQYQVAGGPQAGTYPKVREGHLTNRGFFTSWEAARAEAVDILNRVITRMERDVELLKSKRQQLAQAATPGEQPGGWPFPAGAQEG